MKNQAFLFLIVLLMVSLGANYIQMRSAVEQQNYRDQENNRFQVEQKKKLQVIASRDTVIQSLLNERKVDSSKYAFEQGRLKTRLNALRGVIRNSAPIQDTIIIYQDSLIASLEAEKDTLYLKDNTVIDSLQSQVEEITGLFREQWKRADRFQRDYEREKRKRFSVGPHAGWDFNGPSIGVSVQYAIFRF